VINYAPLIGWVFVDAASRTGLCSMITDSQVDLRTVWVQKRPHRTDMLYNYLKDLVGAFKQLVPRLVVVEGYPYHARGSALHGLVELGTCVRLAAAEIEVPLIEMNPQVWKSVTFRGEKGTKAKDADYCWKTEEFTGIRPGNVDEADALLMAYAAAIILGDTTRWSKGMEQFRSAVAAVK